MNFYIDAQITNMIDMSKTFVQSCELAAVKNDGIKSKEEEKQIKKIKAATTKFIKELEAAKQK